MIENEIVLYFLVLFMRVIYQVLASLIGSLIDILFDFELFEILGCEFYLVEFVEYNLIVMI